MSGVPFTKVKAIIREFGENFKYIRLCEDIILTLEEKLVPKNNGGKDRVRHTHDTKLPIGRPEMGCILDSDSGT